jgi:hypothetical protein
VVSKNNKKTEMLDVISCDILNIEKDNYDHNNQKPSLNIQKKYKIMKSPTTNNIIREMNLNISTTEVAMYNFCGISEVDSSKKINKEDGGVFSIITGHDTLLQLNNEIDNTDNINNITANIKNDFTVKENSDQPLFGNDYVIPITNSVSNVDDKINNESRFDFIPEKQRSDVHCCFQTNLNNEDKVYGNIIPLVKDDETLILKKRCFAADAFVNSSNKKLIVEVNEFIDADSSGENDISQVNYSENKSVNNQVDLVDNSIIIYNDNNNNNNTAGNDENISNNFKNINNINNNNNNNNVIISNNNFININGASNNNDDIRNDDNNFNNINNNNDVISNNNNINNDTYIENSNFRYISNDDENKSSSTRKKNWPSTTGIFQYDLIKNCIAPKLGKRKI